MENKENIRVFTAFSGYDSQCLALERLKRLFPNFGYELVGWSEIDRHAIVAHDALFPQWADRNFGDISKINWEQVPDFDLFTYSFRICCAFSFFIITKMPLFVILFVFFHIIQNFSFLYL